MKKSMKLVALVTAVTLLASAGLVGCKGSESENPAGKSETSSGKGEVTPETQEKVTLNYWNLGNGEQKDSKKVWAEVDRLIQEHLPNTSVNWTLIPGSEYAEK